MSKYIPCPCGSKELYQKCCKRFHDGALPENAEQLMRSRYSAYVLGLPDYIMETTHPSNEGFNANKDDWRADILRFCGAVRFHGLRVLEFIDGDEKAYVSFEASMSHAGKDASFTEKSLFVKENGRWLYVSGIVSEEEGD